ncbi:hypothetical protein GGI08_007551, partial [Coemansia sp. S2]
ESTAAVAVTVSETTNFPNMKLTAVLYTPTKDHVDIMQLAVIAKEVLGATPGRYRSSEPKYLYLSS